MKRKEIALVKEQKQLTAEIFSLRLAVSFAGEVKAGQFVSLFSSDGRRLLPRPISICEADAEEGSIRVVYRVAGKGTEEFSRLENGERIAVMGPLGNGFPLDEAAGKRLLLVGGGIGIPPMLAAAKALKGRAKLRAALGYRTKDTYLLEEMKEQLGSGLLAVSTDDGSLGVKGTVLDAISALEGSCGSADGEEAVADILFACGPKVMLRAVKDYSAARGISCYVSMEERMACGIGVCLGCVCRTTEPDGHSLVKNARVCADGPVFSAEEVDLS